VTADKAVRLLDLYRRLLKLAEEQREMVELAPAFKKHLGEGGEAMVAGCRNRAEEYLTAASAARYTLLDAGVTANQVPWPAWAGKARS
jgi:hypothetical protein